MGRTLSVQEIKTIADRHGIEPFSPRDRAMILLAGLAYFSAMDLTLVRVRDVITERYGIVLDGYLPADASADRRERYFFIGKSTVLRQALSDYIDWRIRAGVGVLDLGLFCGLDPDSRLFATDGGSDYSLTHKKGSGGRTLSQALQVQRQFQRYQMGEGVSLSVLMDSFIANFWDVKSKQGTAQAIRDLMSMTNMTAETLRKKCIRQESSIRDILGSLYK